MGVEEEEGQRGCRGMGMGRGLRRGRELQEEDQKEAHQEAGEDQVVAADQVAGAGQVEEDQGVGEDQKVAQAVRGEAEVGEEGQQRSGRRGAVQRMGNRLCLPNESRTSPTKRDHDHLCVEGAVQPTSSRIPQCGRQ